MSFKTDRCKENELSLVRLQDTATNTIVTVLPAYGALLHSFAIPVGNSNYNIIDNYYDKEEIERSLALSYKSSKLSPFVCRIAGGKYKMDDKTYEFRNKFKDGSAIHGLLFNKVFTIMDQYADDKKICGADVVIDGDIPVGAGMSSSAALCSAYGFALNEIFQLGLSRLQLAFIGQKTEHTFVGVKCGIMDQFASLHGKKGHVIKLDCRSLEYEYIPFDFPDHKIVLVNSMVSHSLAGSEYNVRRKQCEEGVAILQRYYPDAKSLRDIEPGQLLQHQDELPPVVFNRCSYVVQEKERLLAGCTALQKKDLKTFGNLMYATHDGLSNKYAVSCTELDFLVNKAHTLESVKGARMMGGGFGGCTINIVRADAVESFTHSVQSAFTNLFKVTPEVYVTQIEDGAKLL